MADSSTPEAQGREAQGRETSGFARYAAFSEICLVLVLGNLIPILIIQLSMSPEFAALADDFEAADLIPGSLSSGIQLTVKFGTMMAMGFGLLWWRRRLSPRAAGITRNGWPLWKLILGGVVLYAVSALPLNALNVVNEFVPLGEGLELWARIDAGLGRLDFWIWLLVGAVILPPIYEEIVMRGYMRARLQENFGPMGAVIVSSFVFMLAHGHFYALDALLILSLACGLLAAICWAYVVLRSGSVIPAIVAHALFNMPRPGQVELFGSETSVAVLVSVASLVVLLLAGKTLKEYAGAFIADWRTSDKGGILFGVLFSIAFLVPIMTFSAAGIGQAVVIIGLLWLMSFIVFAGISLNRIRVSRSQAE